MTVTVDHRRLFIAKASNPSLLQPNQFLRFLPFHQTYYERKVRKQQRFLVLATEFFGHLSKPFQSRDLTNNASNIHLALTNKKQGGEENSRTSVNISFENVNYPQPNFSKIMKKKQKLKLLSKTSKVEDDIIMPSSHLA